MLSIIAILIGSGYFLWHHGNELLEDRLFRGEPNNLTSLQEIFRDIFYDHGVGMLQLGIVLLIATPITRVASCLILFAIQRDRLYIVISAIVLMILLYSLLWHSFIA